MHTLFFFFFNDTATTEIYTLSLQRRSSDLGRPDRKAGERREGYGRVTDPAHRQPNGDSQRFGAASERSEEHTSELQSQSNLVCRLLLEKKKKKNIRQNPRPRNRNPRRLMST